jgi:hypothetical protein
MKLPGEEFINDGLVDLKEGRETVSALLVAIGAPRLRQLGIDVPEHSFLSPEHRLYQHLATEDRASAHSRYNALIRRLVSFERSY